MLSRILEPEVMDTAEEARDYDAMDHTEVNRRFVDDLLAAIANNALFRTDNKTAGDCPDFSESAEKNGTVPFSEAVLLGAYRCAAQGPPNQLTKSILDLGAGTAQIPIELCQRIEGIHVVAVDAAVRMLDVARHNLEVAELSDRIRLEQADAKRLTFDDATFDGVMSNSIVHHLPDPILGLLEAVRVVRPGGLLFFRDLARPASTSELDRLVDRYAPAPHESDAADRQRAMFAASLYAALSLEEIRELVASLGFAAKSATMSSDRHWTWQATAPQPGEINQP